MEEMYIITSITSILSFVLGLLLAYWLKGKLISQKYKDAESDVARVMDDAKRSSGTLLKEAQLEAKDRLLKMKSDFDGETRETRGELKKQERRLVQKTENIEKKQESFEKREREISRREKQLT